MRTIVAAVLCTCALAATASAEIQARVKVTSGQTLIAIAKRYDCSVGALERANRLRSSRIRTGQTIKVPVCETRHASRKGSKKIVARRASADTDLTAELPQGKGQSIGKPWHGTLHAGTTLPSGAGYLIRRPYRAFGTAATVATVERVIAKVRGDHPDLHVLAIGDISQKGGGRISDHNSHQSGRDVDIGLFYKEKPANYPKDFVKATASNLDRAATWDLLVAFARTSSQASGVQVIFLDYQVQGLLYEWAKDRGVDESYLDTLFQYPDGASSDGLVRHIPNHADHMHVRFKCPPKDSACQ